MVLVSDDIFSNDDPNNYVEMEPPSSCLRQAPSTLVSRALNLDGLVYCHYFELRYQEENDCIDVVVTMSQHNIIQYSYDFLV